MSDFTDALREDLDYLETEWTAPLGIDTHLRSVIDIVDAAERLRDQPHFITFDENGWAIEHDLRCRVAGMLNCPIQAAVSTLPGPPIALGRYEVGLRNDALVYAEPLIGDPAKDLLLALERVS